jgi:1,4-dihydroxy-2-naphthoyl-CoA hydrolase
MSERPDPQQLRDLMPFAALVGIEIVRATAELVTATLAWSPERCTAGGLLHGGALMALADSCGGACAFLNLPDGARTTATIASSTNFLRGVREGTVTASSRPLHTARALIVVETEIAGGDGELVAKVTQTQTFHFPRS